MQKNEPQQIKDSEKRCPIEAPVGEDQSPAQSVPSHLDSFAVERSFVVPGRSLGSSSSSPRDGQADLRAGLSLQQWTRNQALKAKLKVDLDKQTSERKVREAQRRAQERVLEQKEDEAIAKYLQEQQQRSSCASTQNGVIKPSTHETKTINAISPIKKKQDLNKVEMSRVPQSVKAKAKTQRIQYIKPTKVKSGISPSFLNVD